MYINTRLADALPAPIYRRPFDSAERDITEGDAHHILMPIRNKRNQR
ncbi:MAG TPA: hypothetical protein VGN86_03000 [Pyrinomonadaceae bacterium]|nr:hypothetical protein [Pyrinomonadaceae bacterium]